MKVVRAGYGDIDGGENKVGGKENGPPKHMVQGRRSFGNFNRELEVGHKKHVTNSCRFARSYRFLRGLCSW